MPQHPTTRDPAVHDETVRMRPEGHDSRPSPDGARRVPEDDETRPVTRDWLSGAPDAPPTGESPAPAASEDQWETQALGVDLTGTPAGPDTDADLTATQADLPPVTDDGGVPASPGGPPPGEEPPADGPRGPWWRRRAVLVPAGAVALLAAVYGGDLLVSSGDVPRHTVVAGIDIGGLSPAAASDLLEKELAPRVAADRPVVAAEVQATLAPAVAGITLDVDGTVDAADDQPLNPWTRLVSVFGERSVLPVLDVDGTALDAQIEAIAAGVDRAPVDAGIAIDGTTPTVTPPADGRAIDRKGAADAITDALRSDADPSTPVDLPVEVSAPSVDEAEAQRVLDETVTPALSAPVEIVGQNGGPTAEVPVAAIAAALTFTPGEDGKLAVGMDPVALETALGDELKVFGSGAKDATFEISGGSVTIVPSVDGTGIAPDHLVEQLLPVLTRPAPRSVTAELGPVPADLTTEEAQQLGIVEKVSSFTTNFAMSPSATNIRVVAAEVDGALVKPGETFSLNEYTGVRGTAQGYVESTVISGGHLSKAVGGGISQFATTMFNAVFFAGLEDVHHKTHSFYISRYPAGREATVYDGLIDLVWKNDTDTGIYVQTQWLSGGSITVTFWGTKHYEIESLSGEKRNVTEPPVQDKPAGEDCIPQSGAAGFDITVTRVFKDLSSGAELRREKFNTHYTPEAVIHCVEAPAGPPPGN